jgi:hypothetical protein
MESPGAEIYRQAGSVLMRRNTLSLFDFRIVQFPVLMSLAKICTKRRERRDFSVDDQ